MGYLRAHWRGDLPLAVSFWINGVALNVAVLLIMLVLQPTFDRLPFDTVLIVAVSLTVVEVAIGVWQFVGIWRSATKWAERNQRVAWATLAKLAVILGVVRSVAMLVTSAQDLVTVAEMMSDPALRDYEVELVGGATVALRGAITNESVDELLAGLSDPDIELLTVDSHGGLVLPAIRLGRHIRQHDVQVLADYQCASACVLLLAASREPAMTAGTVVTFHTVDDSGEFINPEFRQSAREVQQEGDDFLREMGVPQWAMSRASRQEFWTPTLDQLVEMGIVRWIYLPMLAEYVPAVEYCRSWPVDCSAE